MLSISRLVWLVCFPCVVIATGLRAVGDPVVTYKCSERPFNGLPRLAEASVDDLVTLQSSGSITSVDLVHACFPILLLICCALLSFQGIHRKNP